MHFVPKIIKKQGEAHTDLNLLQLHRARERGKDQDQSDEMGVDEIWSAVHRGGARGGRLSVDGACNQELDGDTRRRDNDLDRFGPSDRRNTLRHVSLVYCIEI